mgnify:CR=1 FL=1|tara:strand:+ start:127207 stop:129231 length:2025 start_codon:yes stop_codon:yes gene_type:complete
MVDSNDPTVKPAPGKDSSAEAQDFKDTLSLQTNLANPFDRVAAFMVDHLIILGPVILLFSAPIKSKMTELAYLDKQGELLALFAFMGIGIGILVFFYQIFFLVWKGATPGRQLFKVKVVHIDPSKEVHPLVMILRTIIWSFETLFFFLPHLAIFNHFSRRPLHDRVCNTLVVSTDEETHLPHPVELSFAKGMYFIFILIFAMGALVPFLKVSSEYLAENREPGADTDLAETVYCDQVTEAWQMWNDNKNNVKASRLQVAMTLFAGRRIDADCLEVESEEALKEGSNKSAIYFAKSLIHSNEPEISDLYLNRVCKQSPKSKVCQLTQVIDNPTPENWAQLNKDLLQSDGTQSYLKIWALSQSLTKSDFATSDQFLEQLDGYPQLDAHFSGLRAKSYWGLHQYKISEKFTDKALQLISQMGSAPGDNGVPYDQSNDDVVRFASWMCSEQLARSCRYATGSACQSMSRVIEKEKRVLLDPTVALAHIKNFECKQGEDLEYMDLVRGSYLDEAKSLAVIERYRVKGDQREYQNMLLQFVRSGRTSKVFRDEAMFRLSQVIEDRPEIQKILLSAWRTTENSLGWQRTGEKLVENYQRAGAYELAAKLGDRLLAYQPSISNNLMQNLVIANYRAGRQMRAFEVLKMKQREPLAGRQLATTSEFQRVSGLLNKKFKQGRRL